MSIVTMLSLALLTLSGVVLAQATPEPATGGDCPVTSEAENIALAERWLDAFAAGDTDAYDTLLADDYVHHWAQSYVDDWAHAPAETPNTDAFLETLQVFSTAFPDRAITIEQAVASGDTAVLRWTQTAASHEGSFFGIEPTGNSVTWTGITILRVECGQIADSWSEVDSAGMQEQMGVIPTRATPED